MSNPYNFLSSFVLLLKRFLEKQVIEEYFGKLLGILGWSKIGYGMKMKTNKILSNIYFNTNHHINYIFYIHIKLQNLN